MRHNDLPLFRNTDPRSSMDAAERLRTAGAWTSQKNRVFLAIQYHPGATSEMIADYVNLDPYIVRKRTADLRNSGLVRDDRDTLERGSVLRWYPI